MTYWKEKVVLVTGGSAGLGLAIARAYAEAGARLVLAARDPRRLSQASGALRDAGYDAMAIPTDVTQGEQVEAMIDQAVRRWGRLDVLVNNAGRSTRGEASATTPEQFQELLDLNFLALVRCTQAALPHVISAQGHIVNIASLAAKTVSRYLGAYPASKFPVAAYSQQLRYELKPRGVHVLLVCPGPIAGPDAGQRYEEQAAGLPDSARKPGAGVKLKRIPAEKLAARILRYCERRKPELVMPVPARLLLALAQLSPSLGDWIVAKMT